jgi:oligosaccharide repeat unit polymerase
MNFRRHPADVARLVLLVLVLVSALTLDDGRACYAISAAAIGASVALQIARRPPFYRLALVWELGFLLIVSLEGLTRRETVIAQVGPNDYNQAARYLVASNAALLLAHGLMFEEHGFAPRTWRSLARARRSAPLGVILVAYVWYLAYSVPAALSMIRVGRTGTFLTLESGSATQAIAGGLADSCGLLLAPMIAYYVLWIRRGHLAATLAFSLPVLGLQFAGGTRFHFLIPCAGVIVTYLSVKPVSLKTSARLGAIAAGVLALSIVMLRVRDAGLGQATWGTLTAAVSPEELPLGEGTVASMSMIVSYFRDHGYLWGASNAGIFLFWIPRAIWVDKPTLLGYWFPRAYGLKGVSAVHSVAATFAADGYVDFGFYGGILLSALLGLCFGRLERWSARVIALRGHPAIVIASTLYGSAFFAVRSLDTTLIVTTGFVALGVLFLASVVPRAGDLQRRHRFAA